MSEEVEKAVKALQAAVRKCGRAGVEVKATYTYKTEDATYTERITA